MDKDRKYRLIQYEKSLPTEMTIKEKLLKSQELGYDGLELSIDETDEKLARVYYSDEIIDDLVAFMHSNHFYIQSICLSALRKYALGSHDALNRKKSLEIVEKAIILAYKLGIRYIQIPGYDVYYEEEDEFTAKKFVENLRIASSVAAKWGVVLGLETMEPEFMNNVEKAMHYVNLINSHYLTVYPDSGNCTEACKKYNANIVDDYLKGKGHIIACHLKEILDGQFRRIQFGKGENDFETTVKTMKSMGVNIFTTEYWAFDDTWEQRCHYAVKFFRDLIDRIYQD